MGTRCLPNLQLPWIPGSCPIFDLLARFDKSGRKVGRALSITVERDYLSRWVKQTIFVVTRSRFVFRGSPRATSAPNYLIFIAARDDRSKFQFFTEGKRSCDRTERIISIANAFRDWYRTWIGRIFQGEAARISIYVCALVSINKSMLRIMRGGAHAGNLVRHFIRGRSPYAHLYG